MQGKNRDIDTENRLVETGREGEGRTIWKSNTETYTLSSVQSLSRVRLFKTP